MQNIVLIFSLMPRGAKNTVLTTALLRIASSVPAPSELGVV